MLKELVRERLIEAADEIFGLFERTIASYEKQLCRAREETERQRQKLEAVCKTNIVLRADGLFSQLPTMFCLLYRTRILCEYVIRPLFFKATNIIDLFLLEQDNKCCQ